MAQWTHHKNSIKQAGRDNAQWSHARIGLETIVTMNLG